MVFGSKGSGAEPGRARVSRYSWASEKQPASSVGRTSEVFQPLALIDQTPLPVQKKSPTFSVDVQTLPEGLLSLHTDLARLLK